MGAVFLTLGFLAGYLSFKAINRRRIVLAFTLLAAEALCFYLSGVYAPVLRHWLGGH